ncbi:MAG: mucoidy inhibitor MuiA family protein [bacterium]|nr:mucoidy inhibitor MuiA family protein [bacterium]
MNPSRVWILALLWAPAAARGADAVGAASSVVSVVVYEDRALVTRRLEIELEAGERTVRFDGLPAGLVDDSLRASGRGAAGVTILGLEAEREYLAEPADERVRALTDEIEALERKATALEDRARTIDMQVKFIDSIGSSAGEGISREMLMREPDPAGWGKVVAFLGEEGDALRPRLRGAGEELRAVRKEIEAARKRLQQIVSRLPRERKNVRVALEAASPGRLSLDLSYVVPGASWRPVYDARADRAAGTVALVYGGQVRQGTGEDWNDVELELSTARPSIGGRPPEIEPWYVDFPRVRPLAAGRAAMAPLMEVDQAVGGPEEEAGIAVADAVRRGDAVVFRIGRRETVPGDNSLRRTTIASLDMPAAFEDLAVPRLAAHAYRTAKVENRAAYPLLAGAVNIFAGPDFIGSSSIDHVAPGETFDLPLGVDDAVTVRRRLLEEEADRSLVRRRTGRRSFRYRIEVENHADRAAKVTVLDQIPVSRHPDIAVRLEGASPAPVTLEERERPGVLAWVLDLAPREAAKIEFGFSVSWPKDREIEGLD